MVGLHGVLPPRHPCPDVNQPQGSNPSSIRAISVSLFTFCVSRWAEQPH